MCKPSERKGQIQRGRRKVSGHTFRDGAIEASRRRHNIYSRYKRYHNVQFDMN